MALNVIEIPQPTESAEQPRSVQAMFEGSWTRRRFLKTTLAGTALAFALKFLPPVPAFAKSNVEGLDDIAADDEGDGSCAYCTYNCGGLIQSWCDAGCGCAAGTRNEVYAAFMKDNNCNCTSDYCDGYWASFCDDDCCPTYV